MADQDKKKPRAPRTVLLSLNDGALKIQSYQFTVEEGSRAGEVYELLEIVTTKRKWSKEINAYYDQERSVTIKPDQFKSIVEYFSRPAPASKPV